MQSTLTAIEQLAREYHKPEAEIMTMALLTGLRQLMREHVLGRYLRGDIARDDAIDQVGIDWVELADGQHQAMREDLAWALAD